MNDILLFALPGNESFASQLAALVDGELGELETRRFPDGESYVRLASPVASRRCVLVAALDRPDDKILSLVFLAATVRELGATRVDLVAPYLAYMRQDRRFREGEAVTSTHFARLVSNWVDGLITVDPHLHRRHSLEEIYSISCTVVHAAPEVAGWLRKHVRQPLLVGPDSESWQWVAEVAKDAGAPFIVLEKERLGDREVRVTVPEVQRWKDHTPVLVDDIISTARTMIETVGHLRRVGMTSPVCIGVHGVFAGNAYDELRGAGASSVVTCNTIPHPSNAIDLASLVATALRPSRGRST